MYIEDVKMRRVLYSDLACHQPVGEIFVARENDSPNECVLLYAFYNGEADVYDCVFGLPDTTHKVFHGKHQDAMTFLKNEYDIAANIHVVLQ